MAAPMMLPLSHFLGGFTALVSRQLCVVTNPSVSDVDPEDIQGPNPGDGTGQPPGAMARLFVGTPQSAQ